MLGAMAGTAGAQTSSGSGSDMGTDNPAPGTATGTTPPGAPTAGQPGIGLDTDRKAPPPGTR